MKTKLYLEPLGENGLPLHNIANIDNCMKSYKKVVGIFVDKEILSCFLEWCVLNDKDIYDAEERLQTAKDFLNRNVE